MTLLRDQSFSISHTRLAQGPMKAGCCGGLAAGVWALKKEANNRNPGNNFRSVILSSLISGGVPDVGVPDCARRRASIYSSRELEDPMGATNQLRWAAVAALACALPLIAHHSFAAEFDSDKTVTLRGTISKVDWINPHIFVYLDVKDDAGKTTTWALQSLPPLFFRGSGLTRDVLLASKQEVTVTANPAKDGTRAYGFMTKLSYPDGHVFSMSPQDADPALRKTQK